MSQFLSACQMGLIYALLAMGVYMTFRVLNTPDLTVDGSFTLGMVVCCVVSDKADPALAILAAGACGMLAGAVTGLLQTKARIHPILAGILTMSSLYTVNMFILGGQPNLPVSKTIFKAAYSLLGLGVKKEFLMARNLTALALTFLVCLLVTGLMSWLFKTHIGLCIRAVGDNEDMVRASSINANRVKVLALAIANGCVALTGAMQAQLQGFADVGAGIGMMVVGIASVIIGELFFGRRGAAIGIVSAVAGSIAYRLIYSLALSSLASKPYVLKLISSVIVVLVLILPLLWNSAKRFFRERRRQHA